MEWYEHPPREDGKGAKHDKVDGSSLQDFVQTMRDADNERAHGLEEKKKTQHLEELPCSPQRNKREGPVQNVIS